MRLPQNLTLFKRQTGVYYIVYQENGKRRWKSTGKKRKNEAIKILVNFKKLTDPPPVRRTLAEFIVEHKRYAEAIYAKKTRQLYESSLHQFHTIVGNRHLTSYTERDVDFFKVARKEQVSVTTVNIELRMLRAAFNTALKWKHLSESPFKGVRFFQVPDKEPPYLSKDEFQKLINIISENWLKDIVITGAMTGMRRGEIINLRWSDVNLKTRIVIVQSVLVQWKMEYLSM
jgi:integrase